MGEEAAASGDANIQTELEKSQLECQKLRLEIKELNKPWWQKIGTWAIVLPLVGGSVWSGFVYFVDEVVLIGRPAIMADKVQDTRAMKTKDIYYNSTIAAGASSTKEDKVKLLEDSLF